MESGPKPFVSGFAGGSRGQQGMDRLRVRKAEESSTPKGVWNAYMCVSCTSAVGVFRRVPPLEWACGVRDRSGGPGSVRTESRFWHCEGNPIGLWMAVWRRGDGGASIPTSRYGHRGRTGVCNCNAGPDGRGKILTEAEIAARFPGKGGGGQ